LPVKIPVRASVYENFIFRNNWLHQQNFLSFLPLLKRASPSLDFFRPDFGRTEWMEKPMRKIHTALLAGAVVAGLGAVAVPSLAGPKSTAHELTLWLPGGGTETITYEGSVAPQVKFHQSAISWAAPFWAGWAEPSFARLDPVIADMNRQFEMLAALPFAMVPDQPLTAAALSDLPAGTSYSMVSETTGNGVCTHVTQITKAPGDAKPKIVSQSSGNCGSHADSHAGQVKTVNLRDLPGRTAAQSL
jgi:hypothetical protein